MDSVILHKDGLENPMEQVIGVLYERQMIAIIFSKNYGANNDFFILDSYEKITDEIIEEAKTILGNITDFSIKLRHVDSLGNYLKQ